MSWLVVLASALAGPDPRVRMTFSNEGRDEDLIDFPVLVRLEQGTNFDHTLAEPDGSDLRFLDADGLRVLPHEIESWDVDGVSTLWVSVPQIDAGSATDHVWLSFGSSGPSEPPTATWADAVAVWHLDPSFGDATGRGHTLWDDDSTQGIPGIAGQSRLLDGDDDQLKAASHPDFDLQAAFTVSAWVAVRSFDAPFDALVTKGDNTFRLHRCNSQPVAAFAVSFDDGHSDVCGTRSIDDGGWHQIVGVYDRNGGVQLLYVDGVLDGAARESRVPKTSAAEIWLGNNQDAGDRDLHGQLDEVRIAPVARSSAWVSADHASVRNTFVRYCNPALGLGDADLDGVCDEDEAVGEEPGEETGAQVDPVDPVPRNAGAGEGPAVAVGCGCNGAPGAPFFLPILGLLPIVRARRRRADPATGSCAPPRTTTVRTARGASAG